MVIQSYSELVLQFSQPFHSHRYQYLSEYGAAHYGWSNAYANRVFRQYIMFLYLVATHQSLHLVPTQAIDCIWEADILYSTAQYMQTCQQLCGRMIHHAAIEELQQVPDFPGIEVALAQTQQLFRRCFGEKVLGEEVLDDAASEIAACGVL